ncbi:MAG TPA: hypothetical protein VMV53_01390 [Acidimicrobiales bacterium]|nr:hypothetical protein [Acidimicrobiales bacterium]
MTDSVEEIGSLLARVRLVNESTPVATLRAWRGELVRASVFVSYAISVLTVDLEVLRRTLIPSDKEVIQALIDDLPEILASSWVGGGWSLSPDASVSVAAAADLERDHSTQLLGLHAEMVVSDLSDHDVVRDLLTRVEREREGLIQLRGQLEERLRTIQDAVRARYASGAASVDDWLT